MRPRWPLTRTLPVARFFASRTQRLGDFGDIYFPCMEA